MGLVKLGVWWAERDIYYYSVNFFLLKRLEVDPAIICNLTFSSIWASASSYSFWRSILAPKVKFRTKNRKNKWRYILYASPVKAQHKEWTNISLIAMLYRLWQYRLWSFMFRNTAQFAFESSIIKTWHYFISKSNFFL